jgi:hypothetical protein
MLCGEQALLGGAVALYSAGFAIKVRLDSRPVSLFFNLLDLKIDFLGGLALVVHGEYHNFVALGTETLLPGDLEHKADQFV